MTPYCAAFLSLQVVSDDSAPLPLDAVYLCGLELRGATWDSQQRVVQASASSQPRLMPLVCVKAQVGRAAGPGSPVYHCPLYGDDEAVDWGLSDSKIITTIPLGTSLNPVLCTLRRMRLVSTL